MSLATHNDHGGKFIHVVTKEMGYSKNQNATMDGTRLKEKRYQWITEGNEIVGCERTWDASGFEMGQFVYTATSQNHPWNDYTAQIYVK